MHILVGILKNTARIAKKKEYLLVSFNNIEMFFSLPPPPYLHGRGKNIILFVNIEVYVYTQHLN